MTDSPPTKTTGKPAPLAGRYGYVTSIKAGRRTLSWLAIDRQTRKVMVVAPVGKVRLESLARVKGLDPGHLAPIRQLLKSPEPSQLPDELSRTRPVGVAIADYVPGETLHARLKNSALPPTELVSVIVQVGRAALAMHKTETPHGSISPRAVVISPKGKVSAPVLSQLIAPTSGAFSSVERLKTKTPSFADDSWALHATLFAGLTGSSPYPGATREALIKSMFEAEPKRLSDFSIDQEPLQRILDRGLARDPEARWSVEALCEALEDWLSGHGGAVHSDPPEPDANAPPESRDDQSYIALSVPPAAPPGEAPSKSLAVPRPFGKSLVGIVVDEPIDADAPEYVPPKKPEDLLDAIDDEDEQDEKKLRALQEKHSKPPPPPADSVRAHAAEPTRTAIRQRRKKKQTARTVFFASAVAALTVTATALVIRYQQREAVRSTMIRASNLEGRIALCVESFFPKGAFGEDATFNFLCEPRDLRDVSGELSRRVARAGLARGSEGAGPWASLGWYELAATATVRRTCCPLPTAVQIELPEPPNSGCVTLDQALLDIADATAHGDTSGARALQTSVECLRKVAGTEVYEYGEPPGDQERRAFVDFASSRRQTL